MSIEYDVQDDFDMPDGTQATPGPGVRVIVDTETDVDVRKIKGTVHPSVLEAVYGEPTISLIYEQFDKITATFQPQRTDDLKHGIAEWIGYRGIMQAMWIIEEGPYAGQWVFGPALEEMKKPDYVCVPWGWIAESDLVDVERYV